jgi:hypothetical protein
VLAGVLVALVSIGRGTASAQAANTPGVPSTSLAAAAARVPIGDTVQVIDTRGATIRGTLTAITEDGVRLRVGGSVIDLAAVDVQRVQWHQTDSWLNGVLIGAGIGAAPGIYWLVADPNECTGLCPEDYAVIGLGAALGALIDGLIKRTVTVYDVSGSSRHRPRVVLAPILTGTRKGVQAGLTF